MILFAVLGLAITVANAQGTKTTTTTTTPKTTKATVTKTTSTTPATTAKSSTTTKSTTTDATDETKTKLSVAQFPKAITDEISTTYPGYKITDAYKLDNKGVISYELLVAKDKSKMKLFYDKDYKFIKKEATVPKSITATKSKAKVEKKK